ncbi:GntR family transcriptional regulator, partial [Kitasatospora sp. MBT63]|uniref:GntR family transcriptional regulator n=1 Tax=Kitasatospora sp. MBT63 TaxID=1444768 RepID=UPI001E656BDC
MFVPVDHALGDLTGQLTRALRGAVQGGRLAAGARLPSTRALAAQLGLSRGVVVECYAQLVAEGYLVGVRGSGTRVAAGVARPPAQEPPADPDRPPGHDLKPGTPDLAAFPRAAWLAATRRALTAAQ